MGSILSETYFIYRRNLKTWIGVPANVIAPLFISALLFVLFGSMFERTISLGGFGWIIDPDGMVLATTSEKEPFITVEIDLEKAELAKGTYPRYVNG